MRALAQSLNERASWDRYLKLEGEHTDLRTARKAIAWIRDEFAAAARLILWDPDRITAAPKQPTLAEFAAAQGMEEFSEADQLEAYEEGRAGQGRAGVYSFSVH